MEDENLWMKRVFFFFFELVQCSNCSSFNWSLPQPLEGKCLLDFFEMWDNWEDTVVEATIDQWL